MDLDSLIKEIFGWKSKILKKDTSTKIKAIEKFLKDYHEEIMSSIDENYMRHTRWTKAASIEWNELKEKFDKVKSELTTEDLKTDLIEFSERLNKINDKLNF